MISRELEQWIQSTWKENVELIHVEKLIGGDILLYFSYRYT